MIVFKHTLNDTSSLPFFDHTPIFMSLIEMCVQLCNHGRMRGVTGLEWGLGVGGGLSRASGPSSTLDKVLKSFQQRCFLGLLVGL